MQTQNVTVLRQMAADRQTMLRRTTLLVGRRRSQRRIRRWIGRLLVRAGARLAADPAPMRPAGAR